MVVWITGASDGIGAALVKEFAGAGYSVVLSARRKDKLEEVAKSAGLSGERHLILPLDLAHTDNISDDIQKIVAKFGRIDVLMLNAGISQKGMAENTLESVEREIMEVNYFANTRLAKAILPYMKSNGGGKIAVVSSIIGKFGGPFLSTYAASKHALVGFFESLRYEVRADGISVLIVTPGFIKTGIAKKAVTEDGSAFNEDSKAQEKGTPPEKVAQRIRKAVESGKKHIYVGGPETFTPMFKFVFPGIFYKIWKKLHKL
ncbi:MAG: SDR family oxidoreductase [Saprospiraceae bacterium]